MQKEPLVVRRLNNTLLLIFRPPKGRKDIGLEALVDVLERATKVIVTRIGLDIKVDAVEAKAEADMLESLVLDVESHIGERTLEIFELEEKELSPRVMSSAIVRVASRSIFQ